MKWTLIAAVVAGVGGASWWIWSEHQAPDMVACEAHVIATVSDSGGYRRLNVSRDDSEPLGPSAFRSAAGPSASVHGLGEAEKLRDQLDAMWAKDGKLQLRLLTLTYATGASDLQRQQICAFRLYEGELDDAESLMRNADATTQNGLETLAILQGRRRPTKPKYTCCM